KILLANQTQLEKIFGQKFHPGLPVIASWPVEHHDRNDPRLARLHQRQHFESFIHRSEAARKKSEGVRFLHEVQFAIEKIIEVNQLRIAFDDRVRLLLERQPNI